VRLKQKGDEEEQICTTGSKARSFFEYLKLSHTVNSGHNKTGLQVKGVKRKEFLYLKKKGCVRLLLCLCVENEMTAYQLPFPLKRRRKTSSAYNQLRSICMYRQAALE